MNAHTLSTRPAPKQQRSVEHTLIFALALMLLSSALWQGRNTFSTPVVAPYKASVIDLTMSGAINTRLTNTSWDSVEATFAADGFNMVFADAPVPFALNFEAIANAEVSLFDLSSGTYPLTVTLLDEGAEYHTFTATEGTVQDVEGELTITAFLSDNTGQQLFLNARLVSDEVQTCSESYRFCFRS